MAEDIYRVEIAATDESGSGSILQSDIIENDDKYGRIQEAIKEIIDEPILTGDQKLINRGEELFDEFARRAVGEAKYMIPTTMMLERIGRSKKDSEEFIGLCLDALKDSFRLE